MTVFPDEGKIVSEFGNVWHKPRYPAFSLDEKGQLDLFGTIERADILFINVEEDGKELHVQYSGERGGALAILTRSERSLRDHREC
jgi:hypothetical protein